MQENIKNAFKIVNAYTGSLDEYKYDSKHDSCYDFGVNINFGTGLYFTEKGIIKRSYWELKDKNGKKTGDKMLYDKKIMPKPLYPTKFIFVNNKKEMEITDGEIKRMLDDDTFVTQIQFRKFLQQFSREMWFDGDNQDVVNIHKILIMLRHELGIEIEKVNNQFGWINDKFSPYDIPVFIDDPALKDLENMFNAKGDKEIWHKTINKYRKNILFETQFLTAISAPLLRKFTLMPIWVHVSGKYSVAKTAAMIAIASSFGYPSENGDGLISSLNTTLVGFENRMNMFNNIPVFWNDSQLLPKALSPDELVYISFECKGRTRGRQDDRNRQMKKWLTCVLSNGEKPLLPMNSFEGAAKRCIQIKGRMMDAEEAKKARRFFYNNYGHLGEEWINIIKGLDKDKEYGIIDKIYDNLSKCKNIDDHILQVTTMCFSRYLFETHINNIDSEKAISESIKIGFKILNSVDVSKDSIDMCNKIVNYLKDFVSQNMGRFGENTGQYERYGFFTKNDKNICFFNNKLDEILIKEFNYDVKLFRSEIKERGLVVLDKVGQMKKVRFKESSKRYPQFKKELFFEDDIEENELKQEESNTNLPLPETSEQDTNKIDYKPPKNINEIGIPKFKSMPGSDFKKFTVGLNTLIKGKIIVANENIDINCNDLKKFKGLIFLDINNKVCIPGIFDLSIKEILEQNFYWHGLKRFNIGDDYMSIMKKLQERSIEITERED